MIVSGSDRGDCEGSCAFLGRAPKGNSSRLLVLCSGRFEVRWVDDDSIGSGLDRSDACPGASYFPFYRPRKSMDYSGGKEKKR